MPFFGRGGGKRPPPTGVGLKVFDGLGEVLPLDLPLKKGDLPLPLFEFGVQLPSELEVLVHVLGVLSTLFGILYLTSLDP